MLELLNYSALFFKTIKKIFFNLFQNRIQGYKSLVFTYTIDYSTTYYFLLFIIVY